MVYQTYNGATYMHAKTNNYHYPDTEAQQKVQGRYWDIMHQWQLVYKGATKAFPEVMPCNFNMFDVWAGGVYQAAQTYPRQYRNKPPRFFGQDKRQSVKLQFPSYKIDLADNTLKLDYYVETICVRRQFTPTMVHTLVINRNLQILQYAFAYNTSNHITLTFQGLVDWSLQHQLRIYVALQNDNYFTNFYRLLP